MPVQILSWALSEFGAISGFECKQDYLISSVFSGCYKKGEKNTDIDLASNVLLQGNKLRNSWHKH